MEITLPLDKMSTTDKIKTMETLWDDLCKNADSLESPEWHEKILKDREDKLKKGEDSFLDWKEAKANIKKNTK